MKLFEYLVISLFALLVTESCNTNSRLQKVEYIYKNKIIKLKIPNGFTFYHITRGRESDIDEYLYKDSSLIYIGIDENGGINYVNISKQKDGLGRLINHYSSNDSLSFQGVDDTIDTGNIFCWRFWNWLFKCRFTKEIKI